MTTRWNADSAVDITRRFIHAKRPCADGYRWYLRRKESASSYQALLDALVDEGRISDACWLLDQMGSTNEVLEVDALDCEALVFAGSVHCRGTVDVATTLRTGRSLRVGAGLRVGEQLQVGEDLRAAGAIWCPQRVRVAGDLRAGWGIDVGHLACEGHLRTAWGLECAGDLRIGGALVVGHGLQVGGALLVGGSLRVGADLSVMAAARVERGMDVGGAIDCGGHLDAGWGIRSGASIIARGAIRAGESLLAREHIGAGEGYGVFAGLCVAMDAWHSSARVQACCKPVRLMSGCWEAA